MKIYLAGGSPKYYDKLLKRYLFSYYGIIKPIHKFSTASDFKFFTQKKK